MSTSRLVRDCDICMRLVAANAARVNQEERGEATRRNAEKEWQTKNRADATKGSFGLR